MITIFKNKFSLLKSIALLVVFFIILYLNNNFFTEGMLLGKYVNKNFEISFIEYNPHVADTLILKENNEFESPFYGKGKYKLSYTLSGTKIELEYGNGFSTSNVKEGDISSSNRQFFNTTIKRSWFFGNPKIILFEDLNQYYEKME